MANSETGWEDGTWQSPDGLTLHFRDYPGRADRPPILCLPGLTRTARDFEPVADAFAGEWRVICAELRGRGESDYAKDSATYVPGQYVADIEALFAQHNFGRVVAVGTSLGGLLTMLLAGKHADWLAGAILNDIGPDIDSSGLERIREYVGQGRSFPTWMHAARALRDQYSDTYPDYEIADWLKLSKRLMCVAGNGRITYDYDMKIAEPFMAAQDGAGSDLWPFFRALSGRPVLALRGELSDILSRETFDRMQREMPDMQAVTVERTGHVPTLDEPAAQAAIADLLSKVA